MSHYGVAVFSNHMDDESFDILLAPYSEDDKQYMTFHPKTIDEIKEKFAHFKEQNPSPVWTFEYYLESFGYVQESGVWGYWYNDNAKYDYYSLDGRSWLEEDLIPAGEVPNNRAYRYRKSQIKLMRDEDIPIAFVTPDGVWHEAGTVGWFATCNDTPESWAKHIKEFKEFLAAPGDEYVSFVDCHI